MNKNHIYFYIKWRTLESLFLCLINLIVYVIRKYSLQITLLFHIEIKTTKFDHHKKHLLSLKLKLVSLESTFHSGWQVFYCVFFRTKVVKLYVKHNEKLRMYNVSVDWWVWKMSMQVNWSEVLRRLDSSLDELKKSSLN